MKKVILAIIAVFLLLVMVYTTYRVNYLTKDNKNLKEKIINIKKDTDKEKENSIRYGDNLDSLKEESSDKEEEYNIWKKAVEKLEKAL